VSYRVWQSLARAEPVDVYPLLRPFAIGLCIMFFPTIVLGTLNTVLSPIVRGTNQLLETQTMDMQLYAEQKDRLEREAMLRDPTTAFLVSSEEFDRQLEELGWSPGDMVTMAGMYLERGMYGMRKSMRKMFRDILELLFQSAALVIDTLRTFFLIVLSILGPVAFAFSVWDGFQSTMTQWLCRYISVYLWLPVADLFSTILAKIQILILQNDIERLAADPTFSIDASNGAYIVFMIIGIIGYFTVPSVAGWVIQAGGMGNYGRNVTAVAVKAGSVVSGIAGSALGNIPVCQRRCNPAVPCMDSRLQNRHCLRVGNTPAMRR
jgi:conjugative transposon TraJ protein